VAASHRQTVGLGDLMGDIEIEKIPAEEQDAAKAKAMEAYN